MKAGAKSSDLAVNSSGLGAKRSGGEAQRSGKAAPSSDAGAKSYEAAAISLDGKDPNCGAAAKNLGDEDFSIERNTMAYDPTKPATNAPLSSAEMRAQLQGLKDLIDDLQAQVNGVRTVAETKHPHPRLPH